MTKICVCCNLELSIDDFGTDNSQVDRKNKKCKKCNIKKTLEWQKKNPDKDKQIRKKAYKKYQQTHKEICSRACKKYR